MKTNVLLGLGLCLSLFMTSCKDDDANPKNLQVSIQSSSQTLVEGGEAVEVTVEMDRTYKELRYLYLEGVGGFFDKNVPHNDGWTGIEVDGRQRYVARIPMPAGERKRTVRLRVDKDEIYQGSSTFEIKVYSYENNIAHLKDSLSINYQDVTPKPVFGIVKYREFDVTPTARKDSYVSSNGFYLRITADRIFTQPQKIALTYSGTAEEGIHYEKEATVVLDPRHHDRAWQTTNATVLRVLRTGNFNPEKTIHIQLSAAEDGVIANGEEHTIYNDKSVFTMENSLTLTVTE